MKNFFEYIKQHPFVALLSVFCVLFATVGVPLIINWFFTIPACCALFCVDWEAKDALAYYGSALGFIGTVIFSVLALWQNHVIKTESDRHTALLEQMEKKKNMPVFFIGGGCFSGPCQNLSFHIYNLSENIALEIVVSRVFILNKDGSEYWSNEQEKRVPHLEKGNFTISLTNPPLTSLDQIISFQLSFQDKFGNYHRVMVEGKQTGTEIEFPRFFTKEVDL